MTLHEVMALADLGGVPGACPHPRVQILSFQYTKFSKCNRFGSRCPPYEVDVPPCGKYWIRHCMGWQLGSLLQNYNFPWFVQRNERFRSIKVMKMVSKQNIDQSNQSIHCKGDNMVYSIYNISSCQIS